MSEREMGVAILRMFAAKIRARTGPNNTRSLAQDSPIAAGILFAVAELAEAAVEVVEELEP